MKFSHELKYLLGALAFSIFVLIIFALFFTSYYFDFFTKFSAAVLGVLLAFLIDRYWESEKKNEDRKDLSKSLRVELEKIKLTPITEEIYPDIWDSAISSGKLSLLLSEQVNKLTDLYRRIRELNNERRLVRKCQEDYETGPVNLPSQREKYYKRWKDWELTHKINMDNLNQKIEKILQDKELWV